MTYESNKPGPFTASKGPFSVTASTLNECADLYSQLAKEKNLGMGFIYLNGSPEGVRHFINENGVINP